MGFKVGDVVVCVDLLYPKDRDYPLVVGRTYKITQRLKRKVGVEGLNGVWSDWQFAPLVLENV